MFNNTSPISPLSEILAYEALWVDQKTSFKTLALMFAEHPGSRPSDFVDKNKISNLSEIQDLIWNTKKEQGLQFLFKGTFDFPEGLKDAKEPVEILYYSGNLDYLSTNRIAIVGTRTPSAEGLRVTEEITKKLVQDDFTIVSGLAAGIDTQAHTTTLASGGRTIAVIGTPLNTVYPRQNSDLQKTISREHLLISQIPLFRYSQQNFKVNRFFFLERNKTMSALTQATLIIEAGETSGSLTQARAALYQKRKLLIWDGCFHNKEITWPQRFLEKGAIRVRNYEDIKKALLSECTLF